MSAKITPFLWFEKEAGKAAKFYVKVFPKSKIISKSVMRNTPSGSVEIYTILLSGQVFTLMSAGPLAKFNEAISFVINCKDQREVDYYWKKLSAVPSAEQCGWLKDKFGVSWQVVPKQLNELLSKDKSGKVQQTMLKMKKIVLKDLEKAYKTK